MSAPENYGARYWAITGEGDNLYLYADRIEVSPSGALVAYGGYRAEGESGPKETMPIYAIAAGEWSTFYAASCISGEMVAADL